MRTVIERCMGDLELQHVNTIKRANRDICFFKGKKERTIKGKTTNRFWWSFVTPKETIVVLGCGATNGDSIDAYNVSRELESKILDLETPIFFAISIQGEPAQCCPLDEIEEIGDNQIRLKNSSKTLKSSPQQVSELNFSQLQPCC